MHDGVILSLMLLTLVIMAGLGRVLFLLARNDRVSVGPDVIRLDLNNAQAIACGEHISQLLGYQHVRSCLKQFKTGQHFLNVSLRQILNLQAQPTDIKIQDAYGLSLTDRYQVSVQRTSDYVDIKLVPAQHLRSSRNEEAVNADAAPISSGEVRTQKSIHRRRYPVSQAAWHDADFTIWLQTAYQRPPQASYPFVIELTSGRLRIHDTLLETLGLNRDLLWINRYRWLSVLPRPSQQKLVALLAEVNPIDNALVPIDLASRDLERLDLSSLDGELFRFRVSASAIRLPDQGCLFGYLHETGLSSPWQIEVEDQPLLALEGDETRDDPSKEAEYLGNSAQVALVEDEPIAAEYLSQLLASLGYQVTWYQRGADLMADRLDGKQFHLIITDWQLAAGESGSDLVTDLRRDTYSGGIVVCSAEPLPDTFGVDFIVRKPVDPEAFASDLKALLDKLFSADAKVVDSMPSSEAPSP